MPIRRVSCAGQNVCDGLTCHLIINQEWFSFMFIQILETPNPSTMQFVVEVWVLESGQTMSFYHDQDHSLSPIAERLFALSGVNSIFLADSFISVTKADNAEWEILRTLVANAITDHFTLGHPTILKKYTLSDTDTQAEAGDIADEGSPVVKLIKELIETRVRPAVAQDGGDIVFHGFSDGVVYLKLYGACSGCPSSTITLKNGIENMLKHYVPEVQSVEQVPF